MPRNLGPATLASVLAAIALPAGAQAACPAGSTYSRAVARTATIAGYWRLADTKGRTACATAGKAASYGKGTRLKAKGAIAGERNRAVTVGAKKSAAVTLPPAAATVLNNVFTFEAWFRRSSTRGAAGIATLGRWTLRTDAAGRLVLAARNQTIARSTKRVRDRRWHHIAVVRSLNGITVVLDGTGVATGTTAPAPAPGRIVVGRAGSTRLRGALDEIAVYSAALPAGQLALHARIGRKAPVLPVQVAAAGDIACETTADAYNNGAGTPDECQQKATSDLLLDPNLLAVLAPGDLQYQKGSYNQFMQSFDPTWGRVKSKLLPVPGNHEYVTQDAAGYFDYFDGIGMPDGQAGARGQGWYAKDLGAWRLIALNSECDMVDCSPTSPQVAFLTGELQSHADRCTLVMMHDPIYSSSQSPIRTDDTALWTTMVANGADLLIVGHHHHYERFASQDAAGHADPVAGVTEMIIGTGGIEHRPLRQVHAQNSVVANETTFGVSKFTLADGSWSTTFQPIAGQTFTDSATGVCH